MMVMIVGNNRFRVLSYIKSNNGLPADWCSKHKPHPSLMLTLADYLLSVCSVCVFWNLYVNAILRNKYIFVAWLQLHNTRKAMDEEKEAATGETSPPAAQIQIRYSQTHTRGHTNTHSLSHPHTHVTYRAADWQGTQSYSKVVTQKSWWWRQSSVCTRAQFRSGIMGPWGPWCAGSKIRPSQHKTDARRRSEIAGQKMSWHSTQSNSQSNSRCYDTVRQGTTVRPLVPTHSSTRSSARRWRQLLRPADPEDKLCELLRLQEVPSSRVI